MQILGDVSAISPCSMTHFPPTSAASDDNHAALPLDLISIHGSHSRVELNWIYDLFIHAAIARQNRDSTKKFKVLQLKNANGFFRNATNKRLVLVAGKQATPFVICSTLPYSEVWPFCIAFCPLSSKKFLFYFCENAYIMLYVFISPSKEEFRRIVP